MDIPFLKTGDKIKLLSPAKSIEPGLVIKAKDFWEKEGFLVELGEYCMGNHFYFSGTDQERLEDFQEALDDNDVRAIICTRGGYGSVRIIDQLNWNKFLQHKKWIVGFSDITVFHQHLQSIGLESIHATMPLNYAQNSPESLQSLVDSLKGNLPSYTIKSSPKNLSGSANGILVGGNLSIIYSLLATDERIDYQNKILFIEDLSEQLYHIDRMFFSLKKAGILRQIKGLILGGFTDLRDTETPFGKNFQDIILDHVSELDIPVIFDFPAGHIDDNRALIFGKKVLLKIDESSTFLSYEN